MVMVMLVMQSALAIKAFPRAGTATRASLFNQWIAFTQRGCPFDLMPNRTYHQRPPNVAKTGFLVLACQRPFILFAAKHLFQHTTTVNSRQIYPNCKKKRRKE
jgi:hypothetical protein